MTNYDRRNSGDRYISVAIIIGIIILVLSGNLLKAQSSPKYTVKNGFVVAAPAKTKSAPKAAEIHSQVNGETFYKGAKGGIYYLRTSKKTGKTYKCYVR